MAISLAEHISALSGLMPPKGDQPESCGAMAYPRYETNPLLSDAWQVSDWNAGQSSILKWSPKNVVWNEETDTLDFILDNAPKRARLPYESGEVQSYDVASTGTWSWTAQAPELTSGSVFGLFTYKADHFNDPWIEFDFEFLGKDGADFDGDGDIDINVVRLNIHMETVTGEHVTLEEQQGSLIIDLGFDATEGFHTYAVTVTGTNATFTIDGITVGTFDASHMPGDIWTTGDMKCFVNLWCVDTNPEMEAWAGKWVDSGTALVGKVAGVGYAPLDGEMALIGDSATTLIPQPSVTIQGTAEANHLYDFFQSSDVFEGAGGQDIFYFVPTGTTKTRGGTAENDIILDFNPNAGDDHDVVVVSKALAGVKGFSQLYRNISDVEGDAVLKFADGSTLTFDGVLKANLSYDDFAFI
ncbi:family 16 glycosylhydrolase [Devosia sp. RR2S18]|uniref:family 16 glycosylhydrolase n=1 Tax=Devosia rhizosphaerae TaxID=3049774 RepID=UPI00253F958F|nr:family 16 glycosylhydrolase [Devosia sp. RR2S18]WIJ24056.1 family 16 glycosylhydrolase [Devosia sp. RR2S18]